MRETLISATIFALQKNTIEPLIVCYSLCVFINYVFLLFFLSFNYDEKKTKRHLLCIFLMGLTGFFIIPTLLIWWFFYKKRRKL